LNLFRKAIEKAKTASNAKDARDVPPPRGRRPDMMSAVRAAVNARGAAKQRQGIRLAKRTDRAL
jgi:hypothetical protein